MTWKAIARSAIGTSHQRQQMPCQDYGGYKILNQALIGAVADGAGSAKYSDIGAKLAVETVLEALTEQDIINIAESCFSQSGETKNQSSWLGKIGSSLRMAEQNGASSVAILTSQSSSELKVRQLFTETVKKVVNALKERAASDGYSIDDLACTLLIVIATPDGVAAMQIADSGEGEVWETNLSGYLAKIYHDPTPARIEKLKVMLANPPADPMLKYNHVSIAWPSDLLQDSVGKYLGFLMPAISDSKQLSSVYNPRRRKRVAPGFNWYYLHVTALNTAWIIQEIHAKGYVLGDIKTENILVNNRALVAVIDTDSFQVRDSQSGKIYRCTVGSEGFTPAELLGQDFFTSDQTEIHDRFRLGVLIHYLLFGYHPFSGQWTGVGESPEQTELIRQGYWYGGHNSPICESRTTISLDIVHPEPLVTS